METWEQKRNPKVGGGDQKEATMAKTQTFYRTANTQDGTLHNFPSLEQENPNI